MSTSRLFINSAAVVAFASYMLCSGCVSVELGAGKAEKSGHVVYNEPTGSFKRINNRSVDSAWQDSRNGNTLAYLSECNTKSELSLKMLETEYLGALTELKILESKEINYNDRTALQTSVSGQVDGVPVRMQTLIFKKNNCNYTLSLVGREKYFVLGEPQFNEFMNGFKAP